MQPLAKEVTGCHVAHVVLIAYRSTGETEIECAGKIVLDTCQCLAKCGAMTFVNDKDDAFCPDSIKFILGKTSFFAGLVLVNETHLLN